jgi:hypothetical protein
MTNLTKRGLRALGVGILLVIVGVAFTASDSETLTALAPLVDLAALVLMVIGVVLSVVGLFRKS